MEIIELILFFILYFISVTKTVTCKKYTLIYTEKQAEINS